jgi:hypothetical protein
MSATARLLDYSYSETTEPTVTSQADFLFSKGDTTTEYLFTCTDGVISGGLVAPNPSS